LAASEVETTVLIKLMINSYIHCNNIHKYKPKLTRMLSKKWRFKSLV
jgi:hypothetical protein